MSQRKTELDFLIEEFDSDEETLISEEIEKKVGQAVMIKIKQCIADYIKHIGEDRGFFLKGTMDITDSFERWSYIHSIMTQCHSNWLRVRNIFIGSSSAYDFCRKPRSVMTYHAPFSMAAGLTTCRPNVTNALTSEAMSLGITMENAVRNTHLKFFTKGLKIAKPGQVVSTRGSFGMSCTADIELQDDDGKIVCLMEVKTMYKACKPSGLSIPETLQSAKMCIRSILSQHDEVNLITGGRSNIFRQKSRFVDLERLKQCGARHSWHQQSRFAMHSHVPLAMLLDCCTADVSENVNLYFYKSDCVDGEPVETFSMPKRDLGLTINPWCATALQMMIQQWVYHNCCCKTIKGIYRGSLMRLLLVVPYRTDIYRPKPYLIMDMPVFFPEKLHEHLQHFYVASVCKYVNQQHLTRSCP